MTRSRLTIAPGTAIFLALATLAVALASPLGTDYPTDAGPAIDALLRGDLHAAFAAQPQMGQLSLFLRWPVAALADLLGTGDRLAYDLAAASCLAAPALLAAWLIGRAGAPGPHERRLISFRGTWAIALAVGVLVANPVVLRALELGHPEEPLGAALCAAALILAARGRAGWAGIALGLALATKQWALLAIVPALLAAPTTADRRRLIVVAGALGAVATLLPLAIDPHAFFASLERPTSGLHELRPGNLWSLLLGPSADVNLGGGDSAAVTYVPAWLRATAHPAVVGIGLLIPLLWWRTKARGRADDVLALLALVMLVRCVVDPWNHEYYHLPFLTALACWEVLAARRLPLLAAGSSVVLWIVFARLAGTSGASTAADVVYVLWAVGMLVETVRVLWWPRGAPLVTGERAGTVATS